ncbi:MAG: EamA family transporter, partial [Chloroflexi bacterium]
MNRNPANQRIQAILLALFVTFLWSTSWVLIKIGLKDIPALTFAGLRYSLAFICLIPFAFRPVYRREIRKLGFRGWGLLILLGLLFYSVTQGTQFLGLVYLPAAMVSLLLNFTSVLVALMGMVTIKEMPNRMQWTGIFINLAGILIFFVPVT